MKLVVCIAVMAAVATAQNGPALRGTVTDPSGAVVPGASVQVRGPGGERRTRTGSDGVYAFPGLRAGRYDLRCVVRGFSITEKRSLQVAGPLVLDLRLSIGTEAQVVYVDDEAHRVTADSANNGSALVLRERELAALSDDPDELAAQLQAMAGPGAGPNGGQIYIDGFTGGMLPSKGSIREVRINSNPFSPEYEKPGFGRIEIFTKPGMDSIHGMIFGQYSKEALNARSPLLTSGQRPPYKLYFTAGSITGPIVKNKASFGFDFHERKTTEDAFVLATALDANLNPITVNTVLLTPQHMTTLTPRLDLALAKRHNLTIRDQWSRVSNRNQGVGGFNLATRAYDASAQENALQVTETAVVNPRLLNETKFQYLRAESRLRGGGLAAALTVQGAFAAGGAQVGDSGTVANRWELANTSSWVRGAHTLRWGGRARHVALESTSAANFGGTFTFLGGAGITALERYRRTLLYQSAGMSDPEVRALGGGASQFTLSAGAPTSSVGQFDAGVFLNDDWRARPNLTWSYGLRYEAQTNLRDRAGIAPRVGVAWAVDARANRPGKTVIRAGAGLFFDRVNEMVTLNALRFNGLTQQSYFVADPSFFPAVPSVDVLAAARLPQTLQIVDRGLRAPRTWQASVGVDRQVSRGFRISANYLESRGIALQRSRDINAPVAGLNPFGDAGLRFLTESTGFSRSHMLQLTPSLSYRKLMAFGFYALSYGMTDAEGQPADPYRLRAEWGPSTFAGVRHRAVIGANLPLPAQFSLSPFVIASSGIPYNITTGRDTNGDSLAAERPALLAGVAPGACAGGDLKYTAGFGCFSLNPAPGAAIGRNAARGPAAFNVNLRLARTWTLSGKDEGAAANAALQGAAAAIHGTGGSGGPPAGVMIAPPPAMMMGGAGHGGVGSGARKYNLTLTVSASNLLNHPNYAPPGGDLSSPYFGVYRALVGGSQTFNRKIDLQLRLTF